MKVVTEWQLNGKRGLLIQHLLGKKQLLLQLYEWYMHPNGQLPAYEWAFGDVNPPVHAWAAWHIYKQEKELTGKGDTFFLERVFQKLLLNSSARSHGVRSRPDVVAPQSLPAPAGWLAAPPSTLYTADIEPLVGPVQMQHSVVSTAHPLAAFCEQVLAALHLPRGACWRKPGR